MENLSQDFFEFLVVKPHISPYAPLRASSYNNHYAFTHYYHNSYILIIHRVWCTILRGWGYCDPEVRTVTMCTAMSTSLSLPGPLHITVLIMSVTHIM